MPEMGFLEGGYSTPDKSGSDRPYLNARSGYTHVVDDGRTQVVRGGIQCALDGGSFQIGMYDITDGVEGEASRVFTQSVTLPERPLDGEDGYVVDTYTFDLDPVPLREYVGRELAVAVRHDSARLWGHNWAEPDGANISTGERGGPLADPWEYSLRDRGSPWTGALFVEPIEIPAGKAQTVLGSEPFADRTQTIFAAFPDLTHTDGMTVEYDERTDAGAAVTVLSNGVVKTGQGSAATDSFAVSVRDTDGTWYGPETITLVERP